MIGSEMPEFLCSGSACVAQAFVSSSSSLISLLVATVRLCDAVLVKANSRP